MGAAKFWTLEIEFTFKKELDLITNSGGMIIMIVERWPHKIIAQEEMGMYV
jgi:hypothetical protein